MDPVDIALTERALTILASTEMADDQLPTATPELIFNIKLWITPDPHRHRIAVSETQVDLSHPLCPTLPDIEKVDKPILAPCRVRLADPVAALFTLDAEQIIPKSAENTLLRLPTL